jgi:CheY-like chemotaxis protein
MDNLDEAVATLQQLRATGIKLSLDDFGTGHSSLSRLRRLPIDHLKIDQSFVRNLTTDPEDAAVCLAIIGLAHNLRMTVIAEGVESEGQATYLRQHRCDEIQGYYFSRPLPAADFERLMSEARTLALRAQTADERRTLLLVDDETSILSALQRVLRQDGYDILTAGSARKGLDLLSTHNVQVILSDQRMPEMNGTEFLARVRDLYPDTVRMVLSGHADLGSITEAINRGAIYKFLTKPWNDEVLRADVREAFRHHESMQSRSQALPASEPSSAP